MIIKKRMYRGITIFGKDIGFFYDVHYFVPYAEYMAHRCEEKAGEVIVERQQSILGELDTHKIKKATHNLEAK